MKTRIAYHATPTRNVPSIRKDGLVVGKGGFFLEGVHIAYSRNTALRYARDLKVQGEESISLVTVRVPYGLKLVRLGFLPPFALSPNIPPENIIKVEKLK